MSIPIYVAAAICALVVALLTDGLKHRYGFCMAGVLVATIGYSLLLAQQWLSVPIRYFAIYLVTCGGYITQPVALAWLSNNQAGHYKRAVSTGIQIGLGNIGGIIASNIYLNWEASAYTTGYGVSLGLIWLCGIGCNVFLYGLRRENLRRDQGKRDNLYLLPPEELNNLGDDYPGFRFTY